MKDDEDIIDHPYLDTKGIITTGVGANIDSKEEFMKVNWQVDGRPATDAEKEAAFQTFEESKNNKEFGPKIKANYFVNKSNLRIEDKEANKMMDKHLEKDLKEIKNEVPNFDKLPKEMKEVLMDIKYNTGNVKQENWPNLHEAIKNKDIKWAAEEVNRPDIGQGRNDWARENILSIEEW